MTTIKTRKTHNMVLSSNQVYIYIYIYIHEPCRQPRHRARPTPRTKNWGSRCRFWWPGPTRTANKTPQRDNFERRESYVFVKSGIGESPWEPLRSHVGDFFEYVGTTNRTLDFERDFWRLWRANLPRHSGSMSRTHTHILNATVYKVLCFCF